MRTAEPDPAPKPATADRHALGLRVSGEIREKQRASGANVAEVLKPGAHVDIVTQARQGQGQRQEGDGESSA